MTEKITKNSTLDEVMKLEKGEETLMKHGVPCVSCPMAQFEIKELKLGEVCETYGIEVKKLLEDLNRGL